MSIQKPKTYDALSERRKLITVFCIAFLSRLVLFAVALAAYRLNGGSRSLIEIFSGNSTGDAVHYAYIAEHWYTNVGEKANLLVFYPMMPILMAVFRVIFRSYILSGIVVSILAFSVGSCYFYKLLRLDYDEEKTAYGMVAFFAAVFGIFFISAHTESLFVMLTAMVLWYTRKKNWLAVGIIGFCAALTKTQGVLLFLPAAYEIIVDAAKEKRFNLKTLAVLFIPLGFLCYLMLNYAVSGDFFKFVEYQAVAPWYNTPKWIADSLATSYDNGVKYFALSLYLYAPQIILFFVAVAALFVGACKKVRTSYLVFAGSYIGATYLHGWMLSGGRYISSCLALYIIYAAVDNKYIKNIILFLEAIFCVFFMIFWFQGQAVM